MAICCETFILKKEIAKMMLETVKKLLVNIFFQVVVCSFQLPTR